MDPAISRVLSRALSGKERSLEFRKYDGWSKVLDEGELIEVPKIVRLNREEKRAKIMAFLGNLTPEQKGFYVHFYQEACKELCSPKNRGQTTYAGNALSSKGLLQIASDLPKRFAIASMISINEPLSPIEYLIKTDVLREKSLAGSSVPRGSYSVKRIGRGERRQMSHQNYYGSFINH